MKFSCLSEAGNSNFPPCNILNLCGFRILFDCPLDLSSLIIFSPLPSVSCKSSNLASVNGTKQNPDESLDANSLIHAEPCYKTVENLHLWDFSLIDVVLISSPMGMLGLPFLTRAKGFSAQVYATEAAARIGQLMMENLVSMHEEFRQKYGPEESGFPEWMWWKEVESLPLKLKEIVLGKDGAALGGWMPLYGMDDVKDCLQKVHGLRYAEEACYNGTLIVTASSSGIEIGSCNWSLKSPKGNVAYISSSIFSSGTAMGFDFHSLRGNDMIVFSDFSSRNEMDVGYENGYPSRSDFSAISEKNDNWEINAKELLNADDSLEEMEKLNFICSYSVDSVKSGGSVLISSGRIGIFLSLLEQLSSNDEYICLKVPIFIISSVAEELLAFTNIIPEWLCKHRQENLYSGKPLFAHSELIKEKKVHIFPEVYSRELLMMWQEPCIVFCPHWSLRLGPVVPLLRRWCGDQNSLLVMEEGMDTELALLPFQPMAMKVLQCSFLSGIKLHKVPPLLMMLQPKLVLLPEYMKQYMGSSKNSWQNIFYSEGETRHIPKLKDSSELYIATELASQFSWSKLKHQDVNLSRLKGELLAEQGKHYLRPRNNETVSSESRPSLYWGTINLESLVLALQNRKIDVSVEQYSSEDGSGNVSRLCISEPSKALIEIKATTTVVSTADESLGVLISEAICSILDGI